MYKKKILGFSKTKQNALVLAFNRIHIAQPSYALPLVRYPLTLLSQTHCQQETSRTQYPNDFFFSSCSDIHLFAVFFPPQISAHHPQTSLGMWWACAQLRTRGVFLPPTPWPPAAAAHSWWLPDQGRLRGFLGLCNPISSSASGSSAFLCASSRWRGPAGFVPSLTQKILP